MIGEEALTEEPGLLQTIRAMSVVAIGKVRCCGKIEPEPICGGYRRLTHPVVC